MIQLEEMDDELTWWVEKNSPNLPVWSGNSDTQSDLRVNAQLMEDLRETNSGAYQYEDVEMQKIEFDNKEIYTLNNRGLPPVNRLEIGDNNPEVTAPEATWKLKVTVNDALAARLPDGLEYEKQISKRWRGRSVRLIIAVDARGKVLNVNPAEWTESKTVRQFENWVYTIPFKPAEAEQQQMVTGVINLS
jgi:hypothetical protein